MSLRNVLIKTATGGKSVTCSKWTKNGSHARPAKLAASQSYTMRARASNGQLRTVVLFNRGTLRPLYSISVGQSVSNESLALLTTIYLYSRRKLVSRTGDKETRLSLSFRLVDSSFLDPCRVPFLRSFFFQLVYCSWFTLSRSGSCACCARSLWGYSRHFIRDAQMVIYADSKAYREYVLWIFGMF